MVWFIWSYYYFYQFNLQENTKESRVILLIRFEHWPCRVMVSVVYVLCGGRGSDNLFSPQSVEWGALSWGPGALPCNNRLPRQYLSTTLACTTRMAVGRPNNGCRTPPNSTTISSSRIVSFLTLVLSCGGGGVAVQIITVKKPD